MHVSSFMEYDIILKTLFLENGQKPTLMLPTLFTSISPPPPLIRCMHLSGFSDVLDLILQLLLERQQQEHGERGSATMS